MRGRAERIACKFLVGLSSNGCNNDRPDGSKWLLLHNEWHGRVQPERDWHGNVQCIPDLHPQPVRIAIAAGFAIAVAWRVRYSLDRSKQLGLVSCRYSVCAIARCLRAIASKRAEQLLGVTAAADHVNNAQSLNSVSERLLLSTERSCGHALLQFNVVWHGNERCISDLHHQPVRVGFAIAAAFTRLVRRSLSIL